MPVSTDLRVYDERALFALGNKDLKDLCNHHGIWPAKDDPGRERAPSQGLVKADYVRVLLGKAADLGQQPDDQRPGAEPPDLPELEPGHVVALVERATDRDGPIGVLHKILAGSWTPHGGSNAAPAYQVAWGNDREDLQYYTREQLVHHPVFADPAPTTTVDSYQAAQQAGIKPYSRSNGDRIFTVVLTGGPGGGKSTGGARLTSWLNSIGDAEGFHIIFVRENATALFSDTGGVHPAWSSATMAQQLADSLFERALADFESALSAANLYAASEPDKTVVILLDRFATDGAAFAQDWASVLSRHGTSNADLLKRVDMVIHFSSMAVAQPSKYEFGPSNPSNPHRLTSPADAAASDAFLQSFYLSEMARMGRDHVVLSNRGTVEHTLVEAFGNIVCGIFHARDELAYNLERLHKTHGTTDLGDVSSISTGGLVPPSPAGDAEPGDRHIQAEPAIGSTSAIVPVVPLRHGEVRLGKHFVEQQPGSETQQTLRYSAGGLSITTGKEATDPVDLAELSSAAIRLRQHALDHGQWDDDDGYLEVYVQRLIKLDELFVMSAINLFDTRFRLSKASNRPGTISSWRDPAVELYHEIFTMDPGAAKSATDHCDTASTRFYTADDDGGDADETEGGDSPMEEDDDQEGDDDQEEDDDQEAADAGSGSGSDSDDG